MDGVRHDPDAVPDAVPDTVPDTVRRTRCRTQRPPDAIPDAAPYVVPDAAPDAAPDAVPYVVPDAIPDAVPYVVPDAVPYAVPDTVPDTVHDSILGLAPDAAPDATPDAKHPHFPRLDNAPNPRQIRAKIRAQSAPSRASPRLSAPLCVFRALPAPSSWRAQSAPSAPSRAFPRPTQPQPAQDFGGMCKYIATTKRAVLLFVAIRTPAGLWQNGTGESRNSQLSGYTQKA